MKEGIIRYIQNNPDNRNISYEDYFFLENKGSMGPFIMDSKRQQQRQDI